MTDLSKQSWDYADTELYAIDWLEKHGYGVTITTRTINRTVFEVSKDGITDTFVYPQGVKNMDAAYVMDTFAKQWEMLIKINEHEKQQISAKEAATL